MTKLRRDSLDDQSHVFIPSKVDSGLDVADTRRIDHIHWKPSLGAVPGSISRCQTGVALRPLRQDGDGVVEVEGRAACVGQQEVALGRVKCWRASVADGCRRKRV